MSEREDLESALDDHLFDVFTESGEMVTKWVTVVETFDEHGQRWLHTLNGRDMATWDTIGMLTQAVTTERGRLTSGNMS